MQSLSKLWSLSKDQNIVRATIISVIGDLMKCISNVSVYSQFVLPMIHYSLTSEESIHLAKDSLKLL
jgi:hypothetical protein